MTIWTWRHIDVKYNFFTWYYDFKQQVRDCYLRKVQAVSYAFYVSEHKK